MLSLGPIFLSACGAFCWGWFVAGIEDGSSDAPGSVFIITAEDALFSEIKSLSSSSFCPLLFNLSFVFASRLSASFLSARYLAIPFEYSSTSSLDKSIGESFPPVSHCDSISSSFFSILSRLFGRRGESVCLFISLVPKLLVVSSVGSVCVSSSSHRSMIVICCSSSTLTIGLFRFFFSFFFLILFLCIFFSPGMV